MPTHLLDPRNGPEHDLAAWSAPPRTYVVASTPRSGSTLLCRMLWNTGLVGAPKEYLNPMQLRDWELRRRTHPLRRWPVTLIRGPLTPLLSGRIGWGSARVQAHLMHVRQHRSSGGWFGLKLHHHHRVRWFPEGTLPSALGPIRWIRITRQDTVRQAISWGRAQQTGQWASWQSTRLKPRYSARLIAARHRDILSAQKSWDELLDDEQVLQLTYESMIDNPTDTLRSVLRFLDVPGATNVTATDTGLSRQADATTEQWLARYQQKTR